MLVYLQDLMIKFHISNKKLMFFLDFGNILRSIQDDKMISQHK